MATARVLNADCFEAFELVPDASVDLVLTDPPYFLDKLGDRWDRGKIADASGAVTSLPRGMKFDPRQGTAFQSFMSRVSQEALRVLKPGGFYLAFSAPRLYHRLGVAVEDAGFEVRDMFAWLYTQNQVKAMSVERMLDERTVPPGALEQVKAELRTRKTPQAKSCLEPIVFAQKPKADQAGHPATFARNWAAHRVGLLDMAALVGQDRDKAPANVLTTEVLDPAELGPANRAFLVPESAVADADAAYLVPKPRKAEKGNTDHPSVKPLALLDQLIRLTTLPGATVLDPFNGSGSTGVSAVSLGRDYVGFELDRGYFAQSSERFRRAFPDAEHEVDGGTMTCRLSAGDVPAERVDQGLPASPATRGLSASPAGGVPSRRASRG